VGGRQCHVQCNFEARSRNCCCRGKALSIKYYKQLFQQCISHVACLTVPYLATSSVRRHDFREKKVIEHKTVF